MLVFLLAALCLGCMAMLLHQIRLRMKVVELCRQLVHTREQAEHLASKVRVANSELQSLVCEHSKYMAAVMADGSDEHVRALLAHEVLISKAHDADKLARTRHSLVTGAINAIDDELRRLYAKLTSSRVSALQRG